MAWVVDFKCVFQRVTVCIIWRPTTRSVYFLLWLKLLVWFKRNKKRENYYSLLLLLLLNQKQSSQWQSNLTERSKSFKLLKTCQRCHSLRMQIELELLIFVWKNLKLLKQGDYRSFFFDYYLNRKKYIAKWDWNNVKKIADLTQKS